VIWSLAVSLFLLQAVSGQGTFQNLNFEQASIVSAPPGYTPSDAYNAISAASALPYWTVMEDGAVMTAVWGAPVALDETSVALASAGYATIQGSYSVQLSAYADAPAGLYHNSSISQTRFIPIGTQSIQFLIASPSQAGGVQPNPIVTLNGTPISISSLSQSGSVITMAGEVSAFAGTTATLSFLCNVIQGGSFPANENIFNLEEIQFSAQSVPEPGSFALLGLGGLFFGLGRWRLCRERLWPFVGGIARGTRCFTASQLACAALSEGLEASTSPNTWSSESTALAAGSAGSAPNAVSRSAAQSAANISKI